MLEMVQLVHRLEISSKVSEYVGHLKKESSKTKEKQAHTCSFQEFQGGKPLKETAFGLDLAFIGYRISLCMTAI